ncbi:hypothetical protein GGU10DRAFT_389472 [Lentinula aff. detonsa]|uniref:Uncharacterized protein n=1 Tax=Lentinula aff. detonsa TaxID=2804958 RepID=A0AA38KEK8_9AGAR|nr:hypothetical protein GGU10DRAFT_389472 [Lentinula aff. detonsa]
MTSTASSSLTLEEIYTPPVSAPSSPVPSDDEDCPPPGKHLPNELRLDRRHDFQFVMPRGDYDMEIALYDSYTIYRENLARDEEEDVIRLLRRELDVCKDQEPRWYYSFLDLCED